MGHKLTIRTDHRQLTHLATIDTFDRRVEGIILEILAFEPTIIWRPGKNHANADGFTRLTHEPREAGRDDHLFQRRTPPEFSTPQVLMIETPESDSSEDEETGGDEPLIEPVAAAVEEPIRPISPWLDVEYDHSAWISDSDEYPPGHIQADRREGPDNSWAPRPRVEIADTSAIRDDLLDSDLDSSSPNSLQSDPEFVHSRRLSDSEGLLCLAAEGQPAAKTSRHESTDARVDLATRATSDDILSSLASEEEDRRRDAGLIERRWIDREFRFVGIASGRVMPENNWSVSHSAWLREFALIHDHPASVASTDTEEDVTVFMIDDAPNDDGETALSSTTTENAHVEANTSATTQSSSDASTIELPA